LVCPTRDQFVQAYEALDSADLLVGASDHGTHLSLYALDPDDNEVEVCWIRPREAWPDDGLIVRPLDVEQEFGGAGRIPA